MIQPHIKLLHVLKATHRSKQVSLIKKYRDDYIFSQLMELMLSPEYSNNLNIVLPPIPRPQKTEPTSKSFSKFKHLVATDISKAYDYVLTLDDATKFVYLNVLNKTELLVNFVEVLSILNITNTYTWTEYALTYGFPSLPCYVQVVPKERLKCNISMNTTIVPTYLDGRYCKNVPIEVLEEVKKLKLKGVLNGYVLNNKFYITNYYPPIKQVLSVRFNKVEKACAMSSMEHVLYVPAYKVTSTDKLLQLLRPDTELVCKLDIEPDFNNKTIILLDSDKLLKLKEVHE